MPQRWRSYSRRRCRRRLRLHRLSRRLRRRRPHRAPAQAAQPLRSPVEGDLVSVDTVGKKITIKPLTGADLSFTYNDKTEISGAQKDAAGLATMKEGRVTVHFTEDAQTKAKTATRIIVEPKK